MRISERPKKVIDFASLVLQSRVDRKLSQEDLGTLIGTTGTHICRIENGKQKPSIRLFWEICLWLELTDSNVAKYISELAEIERTPYR